MKSAVWTETCVMMAEHLDLERRKALTARILIATEFESGALTPERSGTATNPSDTAAEKFETVLRSMLAAADNLIGDGQGSLDESLRRLTRDQSFASVEGAGGTFEQVRERQNRVKTALANFSCQKCINAATAACSGKDKDYDRSIVDAHGNCISSLKTLTNTIKDWVTQLYQVARIAYQPPSIALSTTHKDKRAYTAILKEFHISGWSYSESSSPAVSQVGLDIHAQEFGWAQLCACYYILTHEIVCHAFQSLDGGVREDAEPRCSWSEGWMDRLAFTLAIDWLDTKQAKMPDWTTRDPAKLSEMANAIHSARYKAENNEVLTLMEVNRRLHARQAFDQLRRLWAANAGIETHPITCFSMRLNARTMPREERADLICNLSTLSSSQNPLVLEKLLQTCGAFNHTGDVESLRQALQTLNSNRLI
jgi:hypothetical protein